MANGSKPLQKRHGVHFSCLRCAKALVKKQHSVRLPSSRSTVNGAKPLQKAVRRALPLFHTSLFSHAHQKVVQKHCKKQYSVHLLSSWSNINDAKPLKKTARRALPLFSLLIFFTRSSKSGAEPLRKAARPAARALACSVSRESDYFRFTYPLAGYHLWYPLRRVTETRFSENVTNLI